MVDVCGDPADICSQLFLLVVFHLNDVAVNQHLPGESAEVPDSELLHLLGNNIPFCFTQAAFLSDGAGTFRHCVPPTYRRVRTDTPSS